MNHGIKKITNPDGSTEWALIIDSYGSFATLRGTQRLINMLERNKRYVTYPFYARSRQRAYARQNRLLRLINTEILTS